MVEKSLAAQILRILEGHKDKIDPAKLPDLIRNIGTAIRDVDAMAARTIIAEADEPASGSPRDGKPMPGIFKGRRSPDNPAVPLAESVTENWIICLEDGRRMKMLKRHLKSAYDMTPEEYRLKWGLPRDYPMVAPKYAEYRSRVAKGTAPKAGKSKTAA